MSDVPQGPGWWQASDSRWYPPEAFPGGPPAMAPRAPQAPRPPGQWDPLAPGGAGPGGFGPPAQPGWTGYGMPVTPVATRTDPLAIWSLVLGILGIPMLCLCYTGVPALIAAIPLGFVSRKRIRESQGSLNGDGLALAGAICGIGGLVLLVGLWAFLFAVG